MHTHVEAVKGMLGCKTDRELAQLFRKKSVRTVQLWKREGISRTALHELNDIAKDRGVELSAELMLGLTFGADDKPQDKDAA